METYVLEWDWRITVVTANNTCLPSSHNILLYEDGHAVVADFGGEAIDDVFFILFYLSN